MKNRVLQVSMVLVLALFLTMSLPSSYSKFTDTKTYGFTLTKDIEEKEYTKVYTATNITGEDSLPYTGWYAVIAKGGDGGDGVAITGSDIKGYVDGGSGGVVASYVYFEEDTKLYVYVGTAGGNAAKDDGGDAGTVAALGSGGAGDNGSDLGIGSRIFSSSAASGGGGAATSVFVNSSTDYNKLLCVAGGGGAGGGYDIGYIFPGGGYGGLLKTYPAGMGGAGGSNILGSSTSPLSASKGNVYAGVNGTNGSTMTSSGDSAGNNKNIYISKAESGYNSYGLGGTLTGGAGGHTSSQSLCKEFNGTTSKAGGSYSASNSGGVGGAGYIYGGAGGGGYTGGGGGVGTSLYYACGGGGGGSSFVASTTPGGTKATSSLTLADATTIMNESGYTIKTSSIDVTILNSFSKSWGKYSYDTSSGGTLNFYNIYSGSDINADGFVIVKYIDTMK